MDAATDKAPLPQPAPAGGVRAWFGPLVVVAAVACAISTFVFVSETGGVAPGDARLNYLYEANGVALLVLGGMVGRKLLTLYRAWRRGAAAARLHARIVMFFSVLAIAPALLLAIAGYLTLQRALNPIFISNVKTFVHNTAEAAQVFRESQCRALLQEAQLSATDIDRARILFNADRNLFHQVFASRAIYLGFSLAALVKSSGEIVDRVDVAKNASSIIIAPPKQEFEDARHGEPLCLVIDDGKSFVALRSLSAFDDTFLYVTRPIDPIAIEFPKQAETLISNYDAFDAYRLALARAFVILYGLLTLIMLLSSVWFGLGFADRLVAPIRALIAATDQVSAGNLDVFVTVPRTHGEIARLGDVFNRMTTELDLQQRRLIEANRLNDERREFTEAVLAGVPAAVVGVDLSGAIGILNRSAEELLLPGAAGEAQGAAIGAVMPEIAPVLADAADAFPRSVQSQITMKRAGSERTFNVRVTSAHAEAGKASFVVTLDDITDLVTAQRIAAWADAARRVAHEIKNPLTPIQLSAERLKRKFRKVIAAEDLGVFDQCIDAIVRQVDDIRRIVNDFSDFAKTPRALFSRGDLTDCVRQTTFLMRVGAENVDIVEKMPEQMVEATFDRHLLSRALTNIIKNAVEGIAAREGDDARDRGRIEVSMSTGEGMARIDVIDNGKGFPAVNRQRLLEPYMTTRSDGTGLGLPIVAKIMEDHGGRLELLDAPSGPGACVRLALPLAQGHENQQAAAAAGEA